MHLYENNIKSVLFKGLKFYCKKVQEKKKAAIQGFKTGNKLKKTWGIKKNGWEPRSVKQIFGHGCFLQRVIF